MYNGMCWVRQAVRFVIYERNRYHASEKEAAAGFGHLPGPPVYGPPGLLHRWHVLMLLAGCDCDDSNSSNSTMNTIIVVLLASSVHDHMIQ